MTQIFRFYKDANKRWYIDFPGWTGAQADLEMVQGADTMLDRVSGFQKECYLELSDEPFDGADVITLIKDRSDSYGGGDYFMEICKREVVNHTMWLCFVTTHVFGGLPQKIYVGYPGDSNIKNQG